MSEETQVDPKPFADLKDLKASRFADYKGKVEANIGSMRGPNTLGEILVITEVNYNEATDMTRVGYAYTGIRWDF